MGIASSMSSIEDEALDFRVSGTVILRLSFTSLLERATSDGSFTSLLPSFEDGEVSNVSTGLTFGVITIGLRAFIFDVGETIGRTLKIYNKQS